MRIPVNLASEPFRRDRPAIVATTVCAIVLTGILAVMSYLIVSERRQMKAARADVARLSAEVQNIAREQRELDQVLQQPANAAVLERSLLLNTLVERKSISWNQIFADLSG